jgi:hypothetical protein
MDWRHGNFHFDDREDKIELKRKGWLVVTFQGWNTLQRRLHRACILGRISLKERREIEQGLTIAAQNYMTEQIQRLDALIAQGINLEERERTRNVIASWGKRKS